MDSNIYMLAAIVFLVLCSAFFSGIETAFSCVSTARLKAFSENGSKRAKKALYITENYDKALTTILIGNNIVNLGCSSIATILCMNIFENFAAAISTGGTTLLVLTFGEVIPKCIGKEKSEAIALYTSGALKALMILLTPFSFVFLKLKSLALKILNIKNDDPSVTEDELKYIIESIEEEGVLEEAESEMVQSALEFDEKTVQEIYTPRVDVVAIDIDDPEDDIRTKIIEERFSRIPVYRGSIDNILGILYARDYLEDIVNGKAPDIESLIAPAYFVYKNQSLSSLLTEFRSTKTNIGIVTDEYGGTLGIVTTEDLLEEIVGEIYDEDDEEINEYRILKGNKYLVSGDMEFDDFKELLGDESLVNNTDSHTVGGFIFESLERVPQERETVKINDIIFRIKKVRDRRIISVVVEKSEENAEDK